jgi:hypothetical protein
MPLEMRLKIAALYKLVLEVIPHIIKNQLTLNHRDDGKKKRPKRRCSVPV